MVYVPPTVHVNLLATIRRDRFLPVPGEVLVQIQQHVEANTVIAQTIIPDSHSIKQVAQELGVPPDKIGPFMVKQDGEAVKKDEPIAVRKTTFGLSTITVRSNVDGALVITGDGKALLAAYTKNFELRSGFPGIVQNVVDGLGAVIETTGAVVEGIWGNGKQDYSVMRAVGAGPADPLKLEQLEMGLRGNIIVAGALLDTTAFKRMDEVAIRGLIVGSMRAELMSAVQKLSFPVLVTDGFGDGGFSTVAYALLSGNNGREVWVDGTPADRHTGTRPEAIVPLPGPNTPPPNLASGDSLAVGKRVRIARGVAQSRIGTVSALNDKAMTLPNGLRTRLATIEIENDPNNRVMVPVANLEILE